MDDSKVDNYIKVLQGVEDDELHIPIVYMTEEMKNYFNTQYHAMERVCNNIFKYKKGIR